MRRPPLAEALGLEPHPEGGWFRETYRSSVEFEPEGYDGPRSVATAIYYLLQPGEESRWHVVASDELWLWHSGASLEISLGGSEAQPMREPHTVLLGGDVTDGQQPQVLVPAGVWQARPSRGGRGRPRDVRRRAGFRLRGLPPRRLGVSQTHQLGDAVVTSGGVATVDGDRLPGQE
jgi:uncharacterized protein